MIRVLQFIPSLSAFDGGTTTYMQQLTPALGQLVELHVCALTPVSDFVPLEGCQGLHSIPMSMKKVGQMKREWMAILESVQPDIVHVNCCWMPQIACVLKWTRRWVKSQDRGERTKIFLTPHGMLEPWIISRHYWTRKLPAIWLYQRRSVRQADVIVATAEEEREHLLQLGWNRNIIMVQNGIDVDRIEMKQQWTAPRQLLFMSRIHPKKGLEMLFEALRGMERKDFVVKIAGTGEPEYEQKLKSVAPAKVEFLGAVFGDEKWRLLRDSDLVILPSYSENYGLIVAEALASGTPVITTKGTPWQSIEAAGCGWWIQPETKAIQIALEEAFSKSEAEMQQMGDAARRLAEVDCSVSKLARQLSDNYKKVLSCHANNACFA